MQYERQVGIQKLQSLYVRILRIELCHCDYASCIVVCAVSMRSIWYSEFCVLVYSCPVG